MFAVYLFVSTGVSACISATCRFMSTEAEVHECTASCTGECGTRTQEVCVF